MPLFMFPLPEGKLFPFVTELPLVIVLPEVLDNELPFMELPDERPVVLEEDMAPVPPEGLMFGMVVSSMLPEATASSYFRPRVETVLPL